MYETQIIAALKQVLVRQQHQRQLTPLLRRVLAMFRNQNKHDQVLELQTV